MDILNNTKQIMKKYNLDFKKKFGQNFLVSEEVLDDILGMSDISEDDIVLEIGPGVGTLTEKLLERAKYVVSIELDKDLIIPLSDRFKDYNNFMIISSDILKVKISDVYNVVCEKLGVKKGSFKFKVVANIPYYITTDIISKLLYENDYISSICIMVQKEFANRMKAKVGTKDSSALTYFVSYYADVVDSFFVSKENFIPKPKVDSEVVMLILRDEKTPKISSTKLEKMYFDMIKIGFLYRRKTFLNSIKIHGKYDRKIMEKVFESLKLDKNIRGERITDEGYLKICEQYISYNDNNNNN